MLDAEMKRLQRAPGMPVGPKRAEAIGGVEKQVIWEKGVLGSHSPQTHHGLHGWVVLRSALR